MSFRFFQRVVLVVCSLCSVSISCLYCQTFFKLDSLHREFDRAYGLDPILYNGIKYFQNQSGVVGTAFLDTDYTSDCAVSINGKRYENLLIKYDVYKQVFVLNFLNFVGANEQIVLNLGNSDTLYLRGKVFIKNIYNSIKQPYVQILSHKDNTAYISYVKSYTYNGMGKAVGFEYSELDSRLFFLIKNNIVPIRNKKSFLYTLSINSKKEAQMFLRENRIKFRNIGEGDVKKLLTFLDYSRNQ